jgi:hypothetical protein
MITDTRSIKGKTLLHIFGKVMELPDAEEAIVPSKRKLPSQPDGQ